MTWSVAAGTPTAATATPQTPSYPTTVAGGRLYALIWKKPGTANSGTAPTITDWTLQESLTGSNDGDTGGYGSQDPTVADLGNVNAWIFKRDADADGTESGTVSVTYPNSSVQGTIIICVSTDVGFDSQATATGKQTSDPIVALAITASGDFSGGTSAGDLVLAFFAAASDNGTFATPLITQTGVTFGTTSFVTGTPWMTTQGADGEALAMYASATAGTSLAAPVMAAVTGGTTTNIRGPCVFLRLRETSGSSSYGVSTETDSAVALVGSVLAPYGVSTETDAAVALVGSDLAAYGVATETDTAVALVDDSGTAYGIATETDSAVALVGSDLAAYGVATETDAAVALVGSVSTAYGVATETDAAVALVGSVRSAYGVALELDEAVALEMVTSHSVAPAERTFYDGPLLTTFADGPALMTFAD